MTGSSAEHPTGVPPNRPPRTFGIRGVIEGFYGRPWPWEERVRLVPFLAAHGFTAYAYAPKNDPRHRDRWREPYPPDEWDRFADLTAACSAAGIDFVFGVSPLGLRFDGHQPDPVDLDVLLHKFAAADAIGVRSFCLLVDDMPARAPGAHAASPAAADVALVRRVHEAVNGFGRGRRLWFVPQPYCGATDTPYLRHLGAEVPPSVEICWTGPQVCSAEVTLAHARAIETTLRRPALLWDNHPVNDAGMRHDPHLGPLRGRDPRLPEAMAGIVANLALQPEASRIAIATVGDYAADPAGYVPEVSWARALLAVAGSRADAEAVAALADMACRTPLEPGRRDNALTPAITAFWRRWEDGHHSPAAVDEMQFRLTRLALHAARLTGALSNHRLRRDLLPWSDKLADLVTAAGLALGALRRRRDGRDDAGLAAVRSEVLAHLASAAATPHWVAGDQLEAFARRCLDAARSGRLAAEDLGGVLDRQPGT